MNPVEIKNLKKNYGSVQAVRGVSFDVHPGEIMGLIGPDGAGKTTVIRCLVSLITPDEGQIFFKGQDVLQNPAFVRHQIGYMPQRFSLYPDLTVEENLNFFGDLFQVSPALQRRRKEELYAFSRLGPFKDRRAGALSGGMKQKLALSCMLIHQPDVLVLDEPTFGVDPVSRTEFWEILRHEAQGGTSILITTAYMDEANLCNRVGLMYKGEIMALDSPERLLENVSEAMFLVKASQPHVLFERLNSLDFAGDVQLFGDGIHLRDKRNMGLEGIKNYLLAHDISFDDIQPVRATLEDLFLKLMH